MSDQTLIRADGLTRHYDLRRGLLKGKAVLRALDGVSFTLGPGQTLAVVGESGCGKSTLARQVTLIERPTSGVLEIAGRDVTRAGREEIRRVRRQVQMVFQDPFGSLNPRKKVRSILEEPLLVNTSVPRAERLARVREVMARVGLRPEHADRYPHMFSGGQRQRIAIARSLVLNPAVVVADEPVSALDVSIQAQVLNLLMDLQEEFRLAYLFISHDLSVVRHIAREVLVMYLGRPVEQGPAGAIFGAPRHPYTRALLAATPHVEPGERHGRVPLRGELPSPVDPPLGCAFNTRCPYAEPRCRIERPTLRPVDGRDTACHRAEAIARESGESSGRNA